MAFDVGPTNHLVIVPLSNESHIRPQVTFALNLLDLHPSLIVTNLISEFAVEATESELALHDAELLDRIHFKERFRSVVSEVPGGKDGVFQGMEEDTLMAQHLKDSGLLERMWTGKEGTGRWATTPFLVVADVSVYLLDVRSGG